MKAPVPASATSPTAATIVVVGSGMRKRLHTARLRDGPGRAERSPSPPFSLASVRSPLLCPEAGGTARRECSSSIASSQGAGAAVEDPAAPTNCCVSPLSQKSLGSNAAQSRSEGSTVAVAGSASVGRGPPVSGSTPSSETHFEPGNRISFPCSSLGPPLCGDPAKLVFSLPTRYHTPNLVYLADCSRKAFESYA